MRHLTALATVALAILVGCGDDTETTAEAEPAPTTTAAPDPEQDFLAAVADLDPQAASNLGNAYCEHIEPDDTAAQIGIAVTASLDDLGPQLRDSIEPSDAHDLLLAAAEHLCPEIQPAVDAWIDDILDP